MQQLQSLAEGSREKLAAYWWQRAEGERTSWMAFQHVRQDMCALGAPQAVLELVDRAIGDEYQHSLFCVDWARRFGHPGGDPQPRSEEPLRFRGASDEMQALLRATFCCFTETTGCFVLFAARGAMTDPDLKRLTRRHLADELQHGRAGWGFLASRDAAQRKAIAKSLPLLLRGLDEVSTVTGEAAWDELVQFGYFSRGLLQQATRRAVLDAILPGLRSLGVS
jgi:hypothetical protein